jgi:hypothetical protein
VHYRASSVRLIEPARSVSDSLESEADLHSLRLAHFPLRTASHFCSANRLTLGRKVRYRRSYGAGRHDDAAADSRSREAPVPGRRQGRADQRDGASASRYRRELTRPAFQPRTDTSAARLFFGKWVWREPGGGLGSVRLGSAQARSWPRSGASRAKPRRASLQRCLRTALAPAPSPWRRPAGAFHLPW